MLLKIRYARVFFYHCLSIRVIPSNVLPLTIGAEGSLKD